jgi:hypothetical protein
VTGPATTPLFEEHTMRRLFLCLLVLAVGAGPSAAEEPKAIVERAVNALGGKDLLARQTAWKMTFRSDGPEGAGVTQSGQMAVQLPDRYMMKANLKIGDTEMVVMQAVVGKKGWMSGIGGGRVMDLPEQMLAAQSSYFHAERVGRLLPLLEDAGFTLTALPEEKVEDRPALGVKAAYKGQPDVSIWFDKETGLPVKRSFRMKPGDNLPEIRYETVLSDYRDPSDGSAEEKALAAAGIKAEGAAVRAFLKKQVPDPDAVKKARELVKKLADESFEVREKAASDLVALGTAAVGPLEAAALDDDLEVSRRARACLEQIKTRTGVPTILAAVRWLGLKAPPGTAEALLELADSAEASVTAEIQAALFTLARRPGGPPPALTAALADRSPARRAVAAAALGRDGGAYEKQAGRRLILTGGKVPMKTTMLYEGKRIGVVEYLEVRFYNRFDDKEFARPSE